jgi:hypothetical protein
MNVLLAVVATLLASAIGAVPLALGRCRQTDALKVEPLGRAIGRIATHHFAKRHTLAHAVRRFVGVDRHVLVEPPILWVGANSTASHRRNGRRSCSLLILQVCIELATLRRTTRKPGLLLLLKRRRATIAEARLALQFGLELVEVGVETTNMLIQHFVGLRGERHLLGGILLRRFNLRADLSELSVFVGSVGCILATTFVCLNVPE